MKHSQPSIEDVDMAGQKLARSSKTLVKRAASADNKTNNGTTSKKSRPLVIDDSEEEPLPKSSPPQPASKAPSPKKKTEIQEPASSPTKGKFNYHEYMMRKSAGPSAPGSKEIPAGAPDCLEGLTFVFTGELESLRREEAQDLVKRYGGRVTGAPSGKTSFVVVGEGAGASKLAKIEALGLKTLTEDGLLDLIRSSNTTKGEANDKKETTGRTISISPVKVESVKAPKREHHVSRQSKVIAAHGDDIANELWTDKYAPLSESDLIGNHSNYGKLVAWLEGWNSGQTSDRSVLLSGPPGIGKTTSALLACKQAGFEYVEMNASDTRSKSSLHERVRDIIDNRSLAGFVDFFGSIKVSLLPSRIIVMLGESPRGRRSKGQGVFQETSFDHGRGRRNVLGRPRRNGRIDPIDQKDQGKGTDTSHVYRGLFRFQSSAFVMTGAVQKYGHWPIIVWICDSVGRMHVQ